MKVKIFAVLFLTAIITMLFPQFEAQAQKTKVIEQSSKKKPVWVNSSEKDYIITSAISNSSLEDAKNKAMESIRENIIRAVAENVSLSSSSSMSQKIQGSELSDFEDYYSSIYQTQSAEVPFLKGISASKIEAYYWEIEQTGKGSDSKKQYLYAIKYPFPSVQLKSLTHNFEKRDTEMYNSMMKLNSEISTLSSVEMIDRAIIELNTLNAYFFDNVRKTQARDLQNSYRKLYSNITIRPYSDKLGENRFGLILEGRPITTAQHIRLQSESATQINSRLEGEEIVVTYNYEHSEYDAANKITASLRLGGKLVNHEIYYTVRRDNAAIYPEGTIYLTAGEKSDSTVSNLNIRMTLNSHLEKPFIVRSVIMELPDFSAPLLLDDLNIDCGGESNSTINLKVADVIERVQSSDNILSVKIISGEIKIEIPSTKSTKVIKFSLPYKTNW